MLTEPGHISCWFGDFTEVEPRPGGMVFALEELGSHHGWWNELSRLASFSCRWARPGEGPVEVNSITDVIGAGRGSDGLADLQHAAPADERMILHEPDGRAAIRGLDH
jgi:hypothetical protein